MGLFADVSQNRLEEVEYRLKDKAEDVNQSDNSGNTSAHLAAEKGLAEMLKLLISYGANVNATNASPGWSPLHFAAYEGNAYVIGRKVSFMNDSRISQAIRMS